MPHETPPPPPEDNIPIPLIPTLSPLPDFEDDIPTVRMRVPEHLLEQTRRGPNWGVILLLLACLVFWGSFFARIWWSHG